MQPKKQVMVFTLLLAALTFMSLPALAAHDSLHYTEDGYVRGGKLKLRASCNTGSTIIGYIATDTCIQVEE